MTTFCNLTPHAIVLNSGEKFAPSGIPCRVDQITSEFNSDGIATTSFGNIELPDPRPGVIYIASMVVAQAAAKLGRADIVAPATNHPDTRRNEAGHIVSVPGFILF